VSVGRGRQEFNSTLDDVGTGRQLLLRPAGIVLKITTDRGNALKSSDLAEQIRRSFAKCERRDASVSLSVLQKFTRTVEIVLRLPRFIPDSLDRCLKAGATLRRPNTGPDGPIRERSKDLQLIDPPHARDCFPRFDLFLGKRSINFVALRWADEAAWYRDLSDVTPDLAAKRSLAPLTSCPTRITRSSKLMTP